MDKLTELVIVFKETRNEVVVADILRLSEGLIWGVFKYYKIENLPAPVQEEIASDCRSLVLTKTIEAFDLSRKAKFSTFYTWRLKSHIRAKKESYLRRRNIVQAVSLDAPSFDGETSSSFLLETLTNPHYSYRTFGVVKKIMSDLFV